MVEPEVCQISRVGWNGQFQFDWMSVDAGSHQSLHGPTHGNRRGIGPVSWSRQDQSLFVARIQCSGKTMVCPTSQCSRWDAREHSTLPGCLGKCLGPHLWSMESLILPHENSTLVYVNMQWISDALDQVQVGATSSVASVRWSKKEKETVDDTSRQGMVVACANCNIDPLEPTELFHITYPLLGWGVDEPLFLKMQS